jgi:hypothetical protein
MDQPEKINFRQTRDFGETFNVSVKFIRQNFKHFFSVIVAIAGPFVLISSIAGAFYSANSIGTLYLTKGQPNILEQYGISFVLFMVAYVISSIVLMGTTYSYMITYMERGPGNFTVNDISRKLIQSSGRILLTFLVLTLFSIFAIGILVGIGVGISLANSGLLVGLYVLLAVIGVIILMPPVFWQLTTIYLNVMQERKSILGSIGYMFKLMKGNFWWTWIIIVCAFLCIGVASLVFSLPQLIYQMVLMFSHFGADKSTENVPVAFIVVATICTFFSAILHSTLYVIFGFHYYSLAEKKEGLGLMERIDEIGNTPNTNAEQYY